MSSVEALVTPEVMRWARETRRFSIEVAASKIGRPIEDIYGWEDGSKRPTMAQARKAAEVYKRPLAVFYLPEPPLKFQVLQDYRRLPEGTDRGFTPELALLVRQAQSRQEWLKGLLQAQGHERLPFIGSATLESDPPELANSMRTALQIGPEEQYACRSRDEALSLWVERVEASGIYVFRTSDVSCEEARGFVLSDPFAPFLFVNSADAKAAQLFTIAHELSHLWLNTSGVSNLETQGKWVSPEARSVEVLCNETASELILPDRIFRRMWGELPDAEAIENRIEMISGSCKVSSEVVARRLLKEGIITRDQYERLRALYSERWAEFREGETARLRASEGGPSYYRLQLMRVGRAFARTVLQAYYGDSVSGYEASSLLNVKLNNFGKLAAEAKVYTRSVRGGRAA